MEQNYFFKIKKEVDSADIVLVGLGEEWVLTGDMILKDLEDKNKHLAELFCVAYDNEKYSKIIPVLEYFYVKKYIPDELKQAYENLYQLVKDKNYFIISLSTDTYLTKMNFSGERCVNPCGNIDKMQCDMTCEDNLYNTDNTLRTITEIIDNALVKNDSLGQKYDINTEILDKCLSYYEKLKCKKCGSQIVINSLDASRYCEKGYLDNWGIYMKWLQNTINKKLCVLELGVGMQLPSVIRWPFEKTIYYNQKSFMFRIHNKYCQITEKIKDRACGYESNSVLLFSNRDLEADI